MPQTSDPDVGKRSPRNLLLIEDYDALVVAISSALRKFAPAHERHVAGSLREAQRTADEHRPELVIIDLDPPQSSVVEFIEHLRATHPATRLLAFGCGTSREFAAARGKNAGIHFIEKPFELPEFGQLVDELIEPAKEVHNTVADIALVDVIALECIIGRNAVLQVEAGGRGGEIHFVDGHVSHAVAPGLSGVPAMEEMIRWRNCRFSETDRPRDAAQTIHTPWPPLLVDSIAKLPPDELIEPGPLSRRRKRRNAPALSAKTIVVIDDTELLLEFVEEILSAADPALQISTAHTGTEGVRRAQLTRPDLVLLDYSLPDINGDEVCRRLLEDVETARIPIVMMSGHLAQMAATAKQYDNVVATIAKPFVSNDLIQLVSATLAKGPRKIAPKPLPAAPPPPAPSPDPEQNVESKSASRNGGAAAEEVAAPSPPPIVEAPSPPPAHEPSPPAPLPSEPSPPPPPPVIVAAPPEPVIRQGVRVAAPAATIAPRVSPISAPAPSVPVTNGRTVLLGIPLEAITMHLTAALKIGQIRARAASRTVSLSFPPESFDFILALQTGFDIESITVDEQHQLTAIRLVPNRRPIELLKTSGRFNVDDVEIAPSAGLELVPNQASAMRVHMLAAFKMQAVELSPLFDVSRLVLSVVSHRVRISLEASTEAPGSLFDLREVRADSSGNIGELLLSPF